jgi:hypothetical protein
MTLESIFEKYQISLKDSKDQYRHPVDIIEDLFLKLSNKEYSNLMQNIADTESVYGHIFDQARERPYK